MAKHNYFTSCPKAAELMSCIDRNLGTCTKIELYKKLKEIDPEIPGMPQLAKFLKSIDNTRNQRALSILEKVRNIEGINDGDSDAVLRQVFNAITGKLMGLGDTVIDQEIREVQELIATGQKIPVSQRERVMKWLWSGLKSKAEAQIVDLRVNADERAETIFENLLSSAQYGKVTREIIEGELQ